MCLYLYLYLYFEVTFKPRPGHRRTYLIVMMFTMLMNMMPFIGESAFQFPYVKRLFSWGVTDYSWYLTQKKFKEEQI